MREESSFWNIFLRLLIAVAPLGFFLALMLAGARMLPLAEGFALALLASLALPVVLALLVDRIGGFMGRLLLSDLSSAGLRDRLAGELSKARAMKMVRKFAPALEVVDRMLKQMPNHSEALLLKAQILLEGYEDFDAASLCLDQILQGKAQDDDLVCRWAKGLLEEIRSKQSR